MFDRWAGLALIASVLQAATACGGDSTAAVSPEPEDATLTIVSGDRQSAEVGSPLPEALVVKLHNVRGAPIVGVSVHFVDELGAVRDAVVTDAGGLASGRWTLGRKATTERISAIATISRGTAPTLTHAEFTATSLPGPATHVRLTPTADFGSPGIALDTLSISVIDRFDNGVPGAPIAWAVELGGGSVRALSNATDERGIARAIWTLGTRAGDNVLTAAAGPLVARLTVVASTGLPAVSIAVGAAHACALTASGAAYCWGWNGMGQLGSGTADNLPNTLPSRVSGNLVFTQLVAGTFHTCGITAVGLAYCWGGNYSGQLGSAGSLAVVPTRVATTQPFTALTAGGHHTCGLTTEGAIYCWGDNTAGQLGDGIDRSIAAPFGVLNRTEPASIVGGRSFTALAAGYTNTCAIATTGQTYCWGSNGVRELGTAAGTCRMLADPYYGGEDWDWPCSTRPIAIDTLESMTSLTASAYSVCGLTAAGGLMCWGGADLRPTVVPGARVSTAWSVGTTVCGIEDTEVVSCWGLWAKVLLRTLPPFGDGVALVNLSSMGSTSCGVSRSQPSIAYCWGSNDKGQVGDGTTSYASKAVAVGLPRTNR